MAKLTVKQKDFDKALAAITADGMAKAGAFITKEADKRIHINNDDGWWRSLPGEAPHHSANGGPDKRVLWEVIPGTAGRLPRLIIGIAEGAAHLLMLEVGTRPHVIRPRRAKMLRIPWRAEGRGRRQPTEEEIERIGLQPTRTILRKGRGKQKGKLVPSMVEYVYYREKVMHPGTAPRPWLIPTIFDNIKKIASLIVGSDVSKNLAKKIVGVDNLKTGERMLEANEGQMPVGPSILDEPMPPSVPLPPPPIVPANPVGPSGMEPMP